MNYWWVFDALRKFFITIATSSCYCRETTLAMYPFKQTVFPTELEQPFQSPQPGNTGKYTPGQRSGQTFQTFWLGSTGKYFSIRYSRMLGFTVKYCLSLLEIPLAQSDFTMYRSFCEQYIYNINLNGNDLSLLNMFNKFNF